MRPNATIATSSRASNLLAVFMAAQYTRTFTFVNRLVRKYFLLYSAPHEHESFAGSHQRDNTGRGCPPARDQPSAAQQLVEVQETARWLGIWDRSEIEGQWTSRRQEWRRVRWSST